MLSPNVTSQRRGIVMGGKRIFRGGSDTFGSSALDRAVMMQKVWPTIFKRPLQPQEIDQISDRLKRTFKGYLSKGLTVFVPETQTHLWISEHGDAGCGKLAIIDMTKIAKDSPDAFNYNQYSGVSFNNNNNFVYFKGSQLVVQNGHGHQNRFTIDLTKIR